jgi:lipoprotein-releasing system permease protein
MWLWILLGALGAAGVAVFCLLVFYGARWTVRGIQSIAALGSFDLRVGWRYLYSGQRDRMMLIGAGASLAVSVIGLVLMLIGIGGPTGVFALVLGMISAAVFGLLAVFSVFTSVSVLGVAFGVAALTIVLAVTTGFQRQFEDKVLGVNAHVIVLKSQTTFAEYRDVMDKAMKIDPDVLAVQPFIFAEMLVTRGKGELSGVAIKGVDPKLVRSVLDLDSHMIEGSIDTLEKEPPPGQPPPIIMGKELAHKLKAKLGDTVTVVVPQSNYADWDNASTRSTAPRSRTFRVTGIFYSGFDEYDRRLLYSSLKDAQDLEGRGDQVMGVEMKVKNIARAKDIADKLEKALGGPPYQVEDWYELNKNLFTALKLQKLALVIILTLIIIVATVNMVSALTMMVTDKTREIAILKSMGSTSGMVARVFLVLGIAIGGVGTFIGMAIGLVTCYVVHAYGYHLDPKVYLIDKLPIDVVPIEIVAVVGITLVISLVATLFPSQSAAALTPVEGLRYD